MHKQGEQAYIGRHMNPPVEQSANDAFSDFGSLTDPAALSVKLAAIFDSLTFAQRERVLLKLGYDPVRQFRDEQSGHTIKLHRFYGFGDAGGLAGDADGYPTRELAIQAIGQEHEKSAIGTSPTELGEVAICVLSGAEFVARLQQIDNLAEYGRFV